MGYPCTGRGQAECPRLNVLSNPGVVVNGVPTGIEGRANNARVFTTAGGWMSRLYEVGGAGKGVDEEGSAVASADGAGN